MGLRDPDCPIEHAHFRRMEIQIMLLKVGLDGGVVNLNAYPLVLFALLLPPTALVPLLLVAARRRHVMALLAGDEKNLPATRPTAFLFRVSRRQLLGIILQVIKTVGECSCVGSG